MDKNSVHYQQVKLLVRVLPVVAKERVFALKGGTAINLFIREFPRLSVDIDLAYLPLEPRDKALSHVRSALQRITHDITSQPDINAVFQDNKLDELRIVVSNSNATIKIEVSPVARGTLHEPKEMGVVETVEDEFGYAEIAVVSLPDLYGGKICAAMDRQHPRDLFDVKMLLEHKGISRKIFVGFLTYVLGHPRPINEVMLPNWQDLREPFMSELKGMTNHHVELVELEETRLRMLDALQAQFTEKDREFLLSFKQGTPDWVLFDEPKVSDLPAIRWKLVNIRKLVKNKEKHLQQLKKLDHVLAQWLARSKD